MIGRLFGQVKVEERVATPSGKNGRRGPYYRCSCLRCGNSSYVATSGDLLTGRIRSCGCYRNSQEFADAMTVHGQRRQNKGITTRAYNAWLEMKRRCDDPNRENYKWYGGRGIAYCKPWKRFVNFQADMGHCPQGYELDRIDTNRGYEPTNCRWTTHKVNCTNRRPREPKLS